MIRCHTHHIWFNDDYVSYSSHILQWWSDVILIFFSFSIGYVFWSSYLHGEIYNTKLSFLFTFQTQNFFGPTIFLYQKNFGSKIFVTWFYFGPHFSFFKPKFFGLKMFLDQKCFGHNSFWPKMFWWWWVGVCSGGDGWLWVVGVMGGGVLWWWWVVVCGGGDGGLWVVVGISGGEL